MDKEKQIEEMSKIMNECCNRYDEQGNHLGNKCYECEEWSVDNHCCCSYNTKEAMALYNAGYRKVPEVASEIFAEIEKLAPWFCENQVFYDRFIKELSELKNKYSEERKCQEC